MNELYSNLHLTYKKFGIKRKKTRNLAISGLNLVEISGIEPLTS